MVSKVFYQKTGSHKSVIMWFQSSWHYNLMGLRSSEMEAGKICLGTKCKKTTVRGQRNDMRFVLNIRSRHQMGSERD